MLTISIILNTDPPQVTAHITAHITAHMFQIQIIINIKIKPTTKIKTKQNNLKWNICRKFNYLLFYPIYYTHQIPSNKLTPIFKVCNTRVNAKLFLLHVVYISICNMTHLIMVIYDKKNFTYVKFCKIISLQSVITSFKRQFYCR